MRRLGIILLNVIILTFVLYSNSDSQLSGKEILSRVESRFNEIKDYTAEAQASVEMERLRIPRRKITIQFKQPDKFNFSAEGFAIIPREGFGFTPSHYNPDKYESVLLGKDTIGSYPTFKIQLTAKESHLRSRQIILWIDSDELVVRKLESMPFEKRVAVVSFEYGKVENKYLLPSSIRVELKTEEAEGDELPELKGYEKAPRRMPRSGSITITFTKYLVNQNLPDKLFEKKDQK